MAALIKTTPGQRKKLYLCRNGVGLIAYKVDHNLTCEVEFFTNPAGQLCYTANGAPLKMEVADESGEIREIEVLSHYRVTGGDS